MNRGFVSGFIAIGLVVPAFGQTGVPGYVITTVAGSDSIRDGGAATSAVLAYPTAVAADKQGNIYIADIGNYRVRKIDSSGKISTIAGRGSTVSLDAANMPVQVPTGVAGDDAGSLYVVSAGYNGANGLVRKIEASGVVRTIAGGGRVRNDGGAATAALLVSPHAIAVDSLGNVHLTDGSSVRKVTPTGTISTVAGSASGFGFAGDGGPATSALLSLPSSLAVDRQDNLYIADTYPGQQRIRKVDASGVINTVAGTTGGNPLAVAVDSAGNVYVADASSRIYKVSPAGLVATVAGTGAPGFGGDGGPGASAQLFFRGCCSSYYLGVNLGPGLALDGSGNLLIADNGNNRIRRLTPSGVIDTLAGVDHFAGDGGSATSALLFEPASVAIDSGGNLFIADSENSRIRKVTRSGVISTVAASTQELSSVAGVAVDASGNLYVPDASVNVIRKITPSGSISIFAGTPSMPYGAGSFAGDEGPAALARLNLSGGAAAVALDNAGNLYIADTKNDRVRKVTPAGMISTVAGAGERGFSGDGGPAKFARLSAPFSVAADAAGNLYIADESRRIRKVSSSGIISSVFQDNRGIAGFAVDGNGDLYVASPCSVLKVSSGGTTTIAGAGCGFGGDGGWAPSALLFAGGLALDTSRNVYVAYGSNLGFDGQSYRIRKLTPISLTGLRIVSGDGQSGAVGTRLSDPLVVRVLTSAGVGLAGVPVTFTVSAGAATLSATSVATAPDGTGAVNVTLGSAVGAVTITASVAGLPPVSFTLTAATAPAGPPPPRISAGGVVGGGLSSPVVKQISPNGIISVFGENFAPAGTQRLVGSGDLVNGRLPTSLGGICVQVGSQLAPIFHMFPGQLNIQVPSLSGTGNIQIQVLRNCGAPDEVRSNTETVVLQAAAPEFLFFAHNPDGRNPIAALNATTPGLVGSPDLFAGATVPAKPGDILTLFGTGFGATDPAFVAGELPDRIASTVEKARVTVGELELSDQDILYVGVAPFLAGVYQLNIRVPAETPDGDLPVTARVGNATTPPGAFLAVKR